MSQQWCSFAKATPPATPPLSIASSHGNASTTTLASSSNNNSTGNLNSGNISRKLPKRKSSGRHGSDCSIHNDDDEEQEEEENEQHSSTGNRLSSPPSSLRSSSLHRRGNSAFSSSSWHADADDDIDIDIDIDVDIDNGNDDRKKKPKQASLLLPPSVARESKPLPSNRRRHWSLCCCCGGCWCCCLRPRCLLALGLCLVTGYWAFKIVWWFLWLARCTEGCYDAAAPKTGSLGPEQVCTYVRHKRRETLLVFSGRAPACLACLRALVRGIDRDRSMAFRCAVVQCMEGVLAYLLL